MSKQVFHSRICIKQGGCISAHICSACYNKAVKSCKKQSSGIIVNDIFVNILVYADDILICAASPYGLNCLLG